MIINVLSCSLNLAWNTALFFGFCLESEGQRERARSVFPRRESFRRLPRFALAFALREHAKKYRLLGYLSYEMFTYLIISAVTCPSYVL